MTVGMSPRDVIAKVLDSGLWVRDFEHNSNNYVHFRTNTHGGGDEHLLLSSYELNNITDVDFTRLTLVLKDLRRLIKKPNQTLYERSLVCIAEW